MFQIDSLWCNVPTLIHNVLTIFTPGRNNMKLKVFEGRSILKLKTIVAMLGLAIAGGSAFAAPISGSYVVSYERTCLTSPVRTAPTPAYLTYSTPDGSPYGYVQIPAGGNVSRSTGSITYMMTVNPTNNTIAITDGIYHEVPSPATLPAPPNVASFGTFTGSGTLTHTHGNPFVDVNLQTLVTSSDAVTQIQSTNVLYRFRTEDKGDTFFSVADRGSVQLRYVVNAGFYYDMHCAGLVTGHRVSKAY
jgi:hypothetical protein